MAGVQAGSAGRLSIEIVAEIARLQQDMDRVRRVVNASGGDIAKMARAANDNLAGIGKGAGAGVQQFARDVAMLKAQLDPAWQAQQRYNQSVELGMRAFKAGAIDRQQFIQHMRQISAELKGVPPHMQRVTVAAGAQRAGMMQLSMQLNDVATMYALGAKPMQIFASQAGQVIQAVQLMSNGTSKFAKFLGGPWGLALTTAAVVLVPLIGNLVSGKNAADDLGSASESLASKLDMQKHSLEEVTKALREYNAEQENARTSTLSALAAQSDKIANNIKEAISIRKNIDAMLDERGARLYQALGQSGGNLLAVPSLYAAQSKQLEQARTANQQYLKDLTTGAKNTIGEIATEMAKIQSDPRYAIEKRFEALRAQAIGAGHDVRTLTGILTGLNKQEQAAIKAYQESQKKPSSAAERRAERLARESAALDVLINGLYKAAAAYSVSEAAGEKARIEAEAMSKGLKAQADIAAYTAQQLRKAVAEQVQEISASIASMSAQNAAQQAVNKSAASGAMTIQEATDSLARLNEQRALVNTIKLAELNNDAQGAKMARAALESLNIEQQRQIALRREWESISRTDEMMKRTDLLRQETALTDKLGTARIAALRGLRGQSLEDAMADINVQQQKGTIAIRAAADAEALRKLKMDDTTEAAINLNAQIDRQIQALWDNVDAQNAQIDLEAKFDREARAAAVLADQVDALASSLGNLRGAGGIIGDLIGVLRADNPGSALLGMGGIGTIAGTILNPTAYAELGKQLATGLNKLFLPKLEASFDETFGVQGTLATTMAGLLQGAGIGATVGGIFGGSGTAQIGGMVGGAIGGALGDNLGKAIGGALGESIGEVAGPIVGSIIGSVVGDALAGTKKGRVDLGSTGITNTYGNSDQRIAAATSLGGSVYDSLNRIAEALGATASGSFSGAIGIRKNTIRYNPTSGSLRTGKGATIYATEAEAIAAAISDAISDGVFTGLSDGVERLLKNGGDLETQLQKALSFQGVFDELKRMKDPQGAALDDLTKWHDNMLAIFNEAGATSDQLAQLEELTGLKRTEIVEKYGDAIANAEDIANQKRQLEIQIMQLEGKTVEALAAARQMEKAAADASLGALYDHIYALQDQASAAAAAAQAADRMASLQIRLAQAQGDDTLATALQLQQELAGAANDAERELIKQIYAAEAASKAAAAAEAQRQKERAEAEEIERQRSQLMLELLRAQGKAEEALAMERQAQLAGLDQSLRALQMQVWAEQDLAKKREDARSALSQSYQKEAQAIQQTIDKFKGFSDTLRDLRDSLFSGTGFDDLASLQRKYSQALTGALSGDAKGFEALPDALRSYRDAAIGQAASAAQARMITARLAQDLTRAIGAADDAVDYNQLQLDALNQSVDGLIDIKDEVASVREAIADLKDALAEQTALLEQVGKTQIRTQQETNRTLRDATDGGYAMKTQAVS